MTFNKKSDGDLTIDEIINNGKKVILYPTIFIAVICLLSSLVICILCHENQNLISIFGVVLMFLFSILYSMTVVPKWKIWAFSNIRNVHELRKRALYENLIFPENSFLDRNSFMSNSDKSKWLEIQKKFQLEDLFEDDISVPKQIDVHKSKSKNLFNIFLYFTICILGILMFFYLKSPIAIFCLAIFSFLLYCEIKIYKNINIPIFTINQIGIKTIDKIYNWNLILDEKIITSYSGRSRSYSIKFKYINEDVNLGIDAIDIKRKQLYDYLRIFRGRSIENKKTTINS